MKPIVLSHGLNDQLWDVDGRCYTDLMTGFGAAILGHANPRIAEALKQQADRLWITGRMPTAVADRATGMVDGMLPDPLRCAGFYSTGMEAAEFAIRVARDTTGRGRMVGFGRSMHGKSLATAALCWPNELMPVPGIHRIPYFPEKSADCILAELREALDHSPAAAVFLEPVQGSGGGHGGDAEFCRELQKIVHEAGALLVVDEILLGFHRTGPRFHHETLGLQPDILLTGKTMGNGFPVSCVSVRRDIEMRPSMLPGSTFSGNPLAMATVVATLAEMQRLDLPQMIEGIAQIVTSELAELPEGFELRGSGAFWVMMLPNGMDAGAVTQSASEAGVILSGFGSFVRLLPAATIEPFRLREACRTLRSIVAEAQS